MVDSARAQPTLVSRLKMQDKCRPPPSSLGLSSKLHIIRKGRNESKMAFQVFTSTNKAFVADTEIIPFFHLSGMFDDCCPTYTNQLYYD